MEFKKGDKVTWFKVNRGSSCKTRMYPAVVHSCSPHRITLQVVTADGKEILRHAPYEYVEMGQKRIELSGHSYVNQLYKT